MPLGTKRWAMTCVLLTRAVQSTVAPIFILSSNVHTSFICVVTRPTKQDNETRITVMRANLTPNSVSSHSMLYILTMYYYHLKASSHLDVQMCNYTNNLGHTCIYQHRGTAIPVGRPARRDSIRTLVITPWTGMVAFFGSRNIKTAQRFNKHTLDFRSQLYDGFTHTNTTFACSSTWTVRNVFTLLAIIFS